MAKIKDKKIMHNNISLLTFSLTLIIGIIILIVVLFAVQFIFEFLRLSYLTLTLKDKQNFFFFLRCVFFGHPEYRIGIYG